MGNIQDKETHFTFHSNVGSINDSFFYFTHWYKNNFVLITLAQGYRPADNALLLDYLNVRGIKYEMMSGACLVMPESVEQLFVEENTFKGLSEIYVCHKKPSPETVPDKTFPADSFEFGDELPEGFLEGIRTLDALVYISDGNGVNIAHKAKEEIIYFVREMSDI